MTETTTTETGNATDGAGEVAELDELSLDPAERLMQGDAWLQFCARLADIGDQLQSGDFPAGPRDRAEGYRYVTRLLTMALKSELDFSDPDYPTFFRHEDPWTQWGGPNADNLYHRAAIDPSLTYRVWMDTTGVDTLLLSVSEGDMQLDEYGVYAEKALEDFQLGPDGRLEVIVSPDEQPGNWLGTDPMARLVTVRQYHTDWPNHRVAVPFIERIDGRGEPAPPVDPADIAEALDRAAHWVERSLHYWNGYLRTALNGATRNEIGKPRTPAGGAPNIAYGSGFWDLDDHHALVITCEQPDAAYWNFQIHTMAWFESGAFHERQTSLNCAQAHIDDDDKDRIVVSHDDPGVPNWIDTERRPVGLLAYRWVQAETMPVPEAEVVPMAELAGHLPAGHPTVSPDERRESLARRREAALARYR